MKRFFWQLTLSAVITFSLIPNGAAAIFTTNTVISPFDTNYDGGDIVISDCTVAIDGSHTFSNLLVVAGGALTHSSTSSGILSYPQSFANESQTLNSTNPVTLLNAGTLTTLSVSDLGQTIVYTNDQDYVITFPGNQLIQLQLTTNSAIPDDATVLVSYSINVSVSAGLNLTVTGNAQVDAGGAINLNGQGFGSGLGNGDGGTSFSYPQDGAGGGYGGYGG